MVRTQIQIPEHLYKEVKRIAAERELSLAELTRRGLEYIVCVYLPVVERKNGAWRLPEPIDLGGRPLAPESQWRELANESFTIPLPKTGKGKRK